MLKKILEHKDGMCMNPLWIKAMTELLQKKLMERLLQDFYKSKQEDLKNQNQEK